MVLSFILSLHSSNDLFLFLFNSLFFSCFNFGCTFDDAWKFSDRFPGIWNTRGYWLSDRRIIHHLHLVIHTSLWSWLMSLWGKCFFIFSIGAPEATFYRYLFTHYTKCTACWISDNVSQLQESNATSRLGTIFILQKFLITHSESPEVGVTQQSSSRTDLMKKYSTWFMKFLLLKCSHMLICTNSWIFYHWTNITPRTTLDELLRWVSGLNWKS